MESSKPVFEALARAWLKENGKRSEQDLPLDFRGFVPSRIEGTFEDLEVQYVDEIDVNGKPWVLVIADGKVHLAHVTVDNLEVEVLFLGSLPGGAYRETNVVLKTSDGMLNPTWVSLRQVGA